MTDNDLAELLWATARADFSEGDYTVFLAVLACNLAGHAPTAVELVDGVEAPKRTIYDALARLVDGARAPLVETARRYTLRRFAHLLPRRGELPRARENRLAQAVPQNASAPPPAECGTPPQKGAPPHGSEGFKSLSSSFNGGGALKAPFNDAAFELSARVLVEFASRVCRLNGAAAAVESLVQQFGNVVAAQALEQYRYAYTNRNREPRNPPGQLVAWCRAPHTMDALPKSELTVARWLTRLRDLVEQGRNTADSVELGRIAHSLAALGWSKVPEVVAFVDANTK